MYCDDRLMGIRRRLRTVSVIRPDTPGTQLHQNGENGSGARNVALDPKTRKTFLPLSTASLLPAIAADPNPRGYVIPGTFHVLVFGK
jgi:hypothetical protein